MDNYFNYFTEIEEHFCRRRGTLLTVSTLDWALMGAWKEAGIPLEAVLCGIDAAFDRYDRKPSKTRKINGLAWCCQEVLAATENMKEAAVGSSRPENTTTSGLDSESIACFFTDNARRLRETKTPPQAKAAANEVAATLETLAEGLKPPAQQPKLEDLERHLTVLEEKLFAALITTTPEMELLTLRTEADREIAPYRSKMPAAQIEQLQKQYIRKRLLEKAGFPRLSLFYM